MGDRLRTDSVVDLRRNPQIMLRFGELGDSRSNTMSLIGFF
jgi:hypothetical protein